MRLIFLTLLAVNAVIFGYGLWGAYGPLSYQSSSYANNPDGDAEQSSLAKADAVPSLVLLDERNAKKQPIETIRLTKKTVLSHNSVSSSDIVPVSRSLCILVGSFSERPKAEYFIQRLASLGAKAQTKSLLVSTAVGFWLHLPPLSSRKELLRRLSELQRQGVDSYIIPDGDLANGISLGMFTEAQRAKILQDKMISLGYRPEIAEVPREKRELWVFLLQSEAAKIDDEAWSELLSGKELLQKQQNLCSDLASA